MSFIRFEKSAERREGAISGILKKGLCITINFYWRCESRKKFGRWRLEVGGWKLEVGSFNWE
jgi:hypothetical protein